tara:strand:+ start:62 stop:1447 length:1386 start_codon:yes stop_codon:yes gene_type:complete
MKTQYIIALIIVILIIYLNYDNIKIWILNRIIVLRGILAPNCFWYKISDLVLDDGSGINLYNDYKKKYGDFALTKMFNEKIYLVTNIKYIKTILDNSPNVFGVGNLKKKIFKSFMEKNVGVSNCPFMKKKVGVSNGCPWKKRRHINERALNTNKLHIYSSKYNTDIRRALFKWNNKSVFTFNDFMDFGKLLSSQIVFNTKIIHDDVFNMFKEANTLNAFSQKVEINKDVYNNYVKILKYYIKNPVNNSLVKLLLKETNNKEEIIHQIPHFIFPTVGLFVTTIPRLLVLLFNHRNVLKKVVNEINSLDKNDVLNSKKIYKLSFLRKCILETLRLNNPVVTTFRTLLQDFSFNKKYNFKKGTQFLILNNPILREKEFFNKPNKFIPSRWTPKIEKSYYAISFNQGPQQCPGKELAIFLVQSFIFNFIKIKKIGKNTSVKTNYIDKNNIPQIINPCTINIKLNS